MKQGNLIIDWIFDNNKELQFFGGMIVLKFCFKKSIYFLEVCIEICMV